VGYKVKGKGTIDNCNIVIKDWMEKAGIETAGLSLADGSGLSVSNRISTHMLADILAYMTQSSQWKYFYESLPIAGVDGTLSYRMSGKPVRAKTGTIQGHVGLTGYVKTKTGQLVAFSILTNRHNCSASSIRAKEDHLVSMIASWGQKL
jgi:D-alanyl-D-alanine carboxypeptidase/D-alanyl-D-alanine-endopeptidase (penicillin-binding protein 4)